MSTRESFVATFNEKNAAAIEAAASAHRGDLLESERVGSDTFRDAIVIALSFECMSKPHYRRHHGITARWRAIHEWIKDHGDLKNHDGPIDYVSLAVGVYSDYVTPEPAA